MKYARLMKHEHMEQRVLSQGSGENPLSLNSTDSLKTRENRQEKAPNPAQQKEKAGITGNPPIYAQHLMIAWNALSILILSISR
jgi:hypothetical protein